MKVPVECPHGCGYTLELDLSLTHQHIQCHECACVFCTVCIVAIAPSVSAEEAAMRRMMSKAHLN